MMGDDGPIVQERKGLPTPTVGVQHEQEEGLVISVLRLSKQRDFDDDTLSVLYVISEYSKISISAKKSLMTSLNQNFRDSTVLIGQFKFSFD